MKQPAGVVCLALALASSAVLVVSLVLSIFHKTFEPSWFWLGGVLTIGLFGIRRRNSFAARRRVNKEALLQNIVYYTLYIHEIVSSVAGMPDDPSRSTTM